MPNNEEERRKLAKEELELVLTDLFRMYLNLIKARDDYSVEMVLPEFLSEVTDRVIKYYEGWKSPLDCNKCIDESAERVSDAIQQAREEERKEIGEWLDYQWARGFIAVNRRESKSGIVKLKNGKSIKGE